MPDEKSDRRPPQLRRFHHHVRHEDQHERRQIKTGKVISIIGKTTENICLNAEQHVVTGNSVSSRLGNLLGLLRDPNPRRVDRRRLSCQRTVRRRHRHLIVSQSARAAHLSKSRHPNHHQGLARFSRGKLEIKFVWGSEGCFEMCRA